MTEVQAAYIQSLNTRELLDLIRINGHRAPLDPTDTSMIRGYVSAMVEQDSIAIHPLTNPFTGRSRGFLEAELSDAQDRANAAKTAATRRKYDVKAKVLRIELDLVPSVRAERDAENAAFEEERAEQILRKMVSEADETRELLAQRISDGNVPALAAFSWLQGKVAKIQVGLLAQRALVVREHRHSEDDPVTYREAITAVIEEERENLERNYYRERSSSAFSNATEAEKAEAATTFIDAFRYSVNWRR